MKRQAEAWAQEMIRGQRGERRLALGVLILVEQTGGEGQVQGSMLPGSHAGGQAVPVDKTFRAFLPSV